MPTTKKTSWLLPYSAFTYAKKTTVILDILEEFKYRFLYSFITIGSLVGLVYLNLGLHVEFLWSYYLDYFQFIDFCWYEDIKELNHSSLHAIEQTSSYPCCAKVATNEKVGCSSDCSKTIATAKQLEKFFPSCCNLSISESAVNLSRNNYKHLGYEVSSELGKSILVEVDEFKQLFISILTCFSGQLRWTFDLSNGNDTYSKIQDGIEANFFNICFIFLFYQVILLLVYHIFCFTTPGMFQQSRLKLLKYLQIGFLVFLLHFWMLPYIVSIAEEFGYESVDSEIFFSTNFNFLSSWIYYFYLSAAILFIVYAKIMYMSK